MRMLKGTLPNSVLLNCSTSGQALELQAAFTMALQDQHDAGLRFEVTGYATENYKITDIYAVTSTHMIDQSDRRSIVLALLQDAIGGQPHPVFIAGKKAIRLGVVITSGHADFLNNLGVSYQQVSSVPDTVDGLYDLLTSALFEVYVKDEMAARQGLVNLSEKFRAFGNIRVGNTLTRLRLVLDQMHTTQYTNTSWSKTNAQANFVVKSYHNHYHTCCVLQQAVAMFDDRGYSFEEFCQLAELVVAAVFHDCGHSGGWDNDSINVSRAIVSMSEWCGVQTVPLMPDCIADLIMATRYPFMDFVPCNDKNLHWKYIRDFDLTQCFRTSWLRQFMGLVNELTQFNNPEENKRLRDLDIDTIRKHLERQYKFIESATFFYPEHKFLNTGLTHEQCRTRHMTQLQALLQELN